MASDDSFIYLYNCGDHMAMAKAKCIGHKGPVSHNLAFICWACPCGVSNRRTLGGRT